MKDRRLRKLVAWAIGIAALGGIAVGAFFSANLLRGNTGGPVQVVNAPADVVARGKYLAEAADCAACHTAPGGAPFAGGLAMQSGFGTIYATNITRTRGTALAGGPPMISGARCMTAFGATGSSFIRQCPTRLIAE